MSESTVSKAKALPSDCRRGLIPFHPSVNRHVSVSRFLLVAWGAQSLRPVPPCPTRFRRSQSLKIRRGNPACTMQRIIWVGRSRSQIGHVADRIPDRGEFLRHQMRLLRHRNDAMARRNQNQASPLLRHTKHSAIKYIEANLESNIGYSAKWPTSKRPSIIKSSVKEFK